MRPRVLMYLGGALVVLGILFLATAGVHFVSKGNSRDATGAVIGILLIVSGSRGWVRYRRAARAREDQPSDGPADR